MSKHQGLYNILKKKKIKISFKVFLDKPFLSFKCINSSYMNFSCFCFFVNFYSSSLTL